MHGLLGIVQGLSIDETPSRANRERIHIFRSTDICDVQGHSFMITFTLNVDNRIVRMLPA